jgi:hypothetical protein
MFARTNHKGGTVARAFTKVGAGANATVNVNVDLDVNTAVGADADADAGAELDTDTGEQTPSVPQSTTAITDNAATLVNDAAPTSNQGVRCAFFDRNLHSMMPLVPTPARLKRAGV